MRLPRGNNDGTVSNSLWDRVTSRESISTGGKGKYALAMRDIDTFLSAVWNIIAVANPDARDPSFIWNIVNGQTYPFPS